MKGKSPKKEPPKKDNFNQNNPSKKLYIKNRFSDLAGLAIIILLGIIIYSNSFKCSFHFDDLNNIINNDRIWWLNNTGDWWWWKLTSRPVSMFTFALNYHFHQLDVTYYHIVNLSIHLVNACLVWWLTLLIFSSHSLKDHPISKHKKVLAFVTALLFVSHPLATQSVTYIIQRQNLLAALFYLLSLAFYMKARLSGKASKFKYLLFAGSLISVVLAVFSKENAFTLPVAILLFEIFFLQTKKFSISFKDYRFIALIAAFLSFIIILFLKFPLSIFNPIPPSQSQGSIYTITSLNYLFTQFSVIVKYIQLLILPINQNLDYNFPVSNNFFELRTLFSFLLLLSLIILAVFLFKKNRIFSFGIFWFFLALSIESGFIPINDVIYEHRTYLPSFGFFLILSTCIYVLLWNKYKYLAIAILVIIIGTNSYLTYERNKVWKNELTLWNDVVSKSPDKARPFHNRGSAYGALGQHSKAITDFSRAIEIDSTYDLAYYNRGVSNEKLGQLENAIDDYSKAIEIDPDYPVTYLNRGVVFLNQGQLDKAIADFSKAIKIQPGYKGALYNRGVCFLNLEQWDNSITDFSKVIGIDSDDTKSYSNRAVAWANLGRWDKAIADFSMTIELEPNCASNYNNRGSAYINTGQLDKAIADYSSAIRIDANYTDAYNNREDAYRKLKSGKNQ